jgi:hypothetical protein
MRVALLQNNLIVKVVLSLLWQHDITVEASLWQDTFIVKATFLAGYFHYKDHLVAEYLLSVMSAALWQNNYNNEGCLVAE